MAVVAIDHVMVRDVALVATVSVDIRVVHGADHRALIVTYLAKCLLTATRLPQGRSLVLR